MADPLDPELPAALPDEPQSEAMMPLEGRDAVKKMTHDVDTDDMFGSTT